MSKAEQPRSVSIRRTIAGKNYTGRLTVDGLARLQDLWQMELDEIQTRLNKPKVTDLKDLFYCALIFDQPEMTQEQASKLTNELSLEGLVEFISAVISASRPPEDANRPGPRDPARSRKKS